MRIVKRTFIGSILLVGVLFAIWRVSLSVENRARLKAIASRGEPINGADLNERYLAVPENENAATVWLKGVGQTIPRYRPGAQMSWQRMKLPTRGSSLAEETLEEYRGIIASNAAALATFREAARLEKSRYPADFSHGFVAEYPHLEQLKSAVRLLQVQAFLAMEPGKLDESIEAIATMLAARRSLRAEPTALAQLVAYAIDALACQTLEHLLNRQQMTSQQLEVLNSAFMKSEDTNGLARALVGERALLISTFRPRKDLPEPKEGPESSTKIFRAPWLRATGIIERDLGFCLAALTTNIAMAKLPDPHRFTSQTNWDGILQRAEKRRYFTSSLLLPALAKIGEREVADRARLRIAQTAIAIHRFASDHKTELPADLASLVPRYLESIPIDPFDGKPLRFTKRDRGYVVYSVGRDARDDGGTEWQRGRPKGAPEDVTFIVERPQSE